MGTRFERVRAKDLVKVFGATRALAGVTATFEAGKITVVEGPNGSGKSTLLALLAQLARPTRGTVLYGKIDARHGGASLRNSIGVLAHASMVYPDLTGQENIELFAALHGAADPKKRASELIERFDIGRFLNRPARTYSRGQLQRVALARALVHSPSLLLLDEPSTGLDDKAVNSLVEAVTQERDRGTILVLVTHDMELAARIADRRIRLERGRVVDGGQA